MAKLAKEKEEEKATRINTSNRLNNLIEERKSMENNYKEEIDLLNQDLSELKEHLVNVTKYDFFFKISITLKFTEWISSA